MHVLVVGEDVPGRTYAYGLGLGYEPLKSNFAT
jgi:hypothetical protein